MCWEGQCTNGDATSNVGDIETLNFNSGGCTFCLKTAPNFLSIWQINHCEKYAVNLNLNYMHSIKNKNNKEKIQQYAFNETIKNKF